MRSFHLGGCLAALLPLLAAGCSASAPQPPQDKETKIKAALAQLDPGDRTAAEEQKYCAVQTKNRLGSMGKPIKLTLKDETVFVCCEGCEAIAKKDPDKTLALAEEARIRAALEQLDPADRRLAEEQKYCAVEPENRLGSMGPPVKLMLKEQPVFLCCGGCTKAAKNDPDTTLAAVKKLKAASTTPAKE